MLADATERAVGRRRGGADRDGASPQPVPRAAGATPRPWRWGGSAAARVASDGGARRAADRRGGGPGDLGSADRGAGAARRRSDVDGAAPPRARRDASCRGVGDDRSDGRGDRVSEQAYRRPPGARRRAGHRLARHAPREPAVRAGPGGTTRRGRARGAGVVRRSPTGRGMPLGVIWLGVHLARCALAQGRPATALRVDRAGVHGDRRVRVRGAAADRLRDARRSPTACSATPRRAPRAPTEVDALTIRVRVPRRRAAARAGVGAGRRRASCPPPAPCCWPPPTTPSARGHLPAAAWLLHDAARLGAAVRRRARLAALADGDRQRAGGRPGRARRRPRSPTTATRLAVAADAVRGASARVLLAAEAAAAGADAWRRRQEQRRAAALDVRVGRARRRAARGADAGAVPRSRTVVPLTNREREIALLAAAGQPSRVDRRAALPLGAHGRQPPRPHLRQARRVEPRRRSPPPSNAARARQPMTPEQLELVRSSYAALGRRRAGDGASDFYARLFAADPSTRGAVHATVRTSWP